LHAVSPFRWPHSSVELAWARMALELAHAIIARQRGQRRLEARHLQAAMAHAMTAGVDDDIVPRLYDVLLDGARPTRPRGGGGGESDPGLVIDGTHHEVRIDGRRIAFGARPAIRTLLYAFAGAASNHLTRTMIARALWDTDYDPLRHDSTIKSSIRRLRVMLAGIAEVHVGHDGYHLVLPPDATFIPPVVGALEARS
jgi:DNA-binding response OmpR family regulator